MDYRTSAETAVLTEDLCKSCWESDDWLYNPEIVVVATRGIRY